jgi:hypothetical protein
MLVGVDESEPGGRPGDHILVDLPDGQTMRCRIVNVTDDGTILVVPEHDVVIVGAEASPSSCGSASPHERGVRTAWRRRGDGASLVGDGAELVGEFGGDVPIFGGAGEAGCVGVGGFDEGVGVVGGESVEADAGFAGTVEGGDSVFGAAAEALDVPDEAGVGCGVLGDLGVDRVAELAVVGGVVAGARSADEQGHGWAPGVPEADTPG